VESDDDLDLMLDQALSSYCEVEPRPGIEARVLHRVRTARRGMRWLWLVPVPLVLALGFAFEFRAVEPPSPVSIAVIARAPSSVTPVEVHRVSVRRQHRKRVVPGVLVVASLPKKDVFPTPAPLTPEEEALVFMTAGHLTETQVLADQREIEPIQIPELRIDALKDALKNDGE
jgi:hypothetical protein